MINGLLATMCAAVLVAVGGTDAAAEKVGHSAVSPAVEVYLEQVYEILQRESLFRAETDWAAVRELLFSRAADAREPRDAYVAIADSLRLIDHHSLFVDPDWNVVRPSDYVKRKRPFASREPHGELLEGGIVYLYIPGHSPKSEDDSRRYVAKVRSVMARDGIGCGWVVDLRGNTGGNMWPMLEALAPIFNPGPSDRLGAWVDGEGEILRWWGVRDDRGFDGADLMPDYLDDDDLPANSAAPVAVLIGDWTRSSGEMTAIAFRGRPDTVFVGQESGGFLTVNDDFELSDGAIIALAIARTADRLGAPAGERLVPDIDTEPHLQAVPVGEDRAVGAARVWIGSQVESCSSAHDPGKQ